jgi:Mg/Co/Ni transporter MgtE
MNQDKDTNDLDPLINQDIFEILVANNITSKFYENSEAEFLAELGDINDLKLLKEICKYRLQYLDQKKDLETQLSFSRVALKRLPAIFSTIILGLMSGYSISRYGHFIEKHILMISFLPIISSICGNTFFKEATLHFRLLQPALWR